MKYILVFMLATTLFSCKELSNEEIKNKNTAVTNKLACVGTLQQIFTAIEQKNIENIKAVLPLTDEVEFIMPNTAVQNKEDLLLFYNTLFNRTNWTMRSEILQSSIGSDFATFTVKQIYTEQERNNQPYLHEMLVTYVVQHKGNNRWVLRKHHASTVLKQQ